MRNILRMTTVKVLSSVRINERSIILSKGRLSKKNDWKHVFFLVSGYWVFGHIKGLSINISFSWQNYRIAEKTKSTR